MTDRSILMAVASYCSTAAAEADFSSLWADPHHGPLGAALIEKGADGRLTIDRHHSAGGNPPWGGPVLGGALTVLAAPVGIQFLVAVVDTGAVLGGVGAIAGHIWNNVPKEQLRRMSELLESGQAALVVVAADRAADTAAGMLDGALLKVIASTSA